MGAPESGTPRFEDGWKGIGSKNYLAILGENLDTVMLT